MAANLTPQVKNENEFYTEFQNERDRTAKGSNTKLIISQWKANIVKTLFTNFVQKVAGKSLVSDTEITKLQGLPSVERTTISTTQIETLSSSPVEFKTTPPSGSGNYWHIHSGIIRYKFNANAFTSPSTNNIYLASGGSIVQDQSGSNIILLTSSQIKGTSSYYAEIPFVVIDNGNLQLTSDEDFDSSSASSGDGSIIVDLMSQELAV